MAWDDLPPPQASPTPQPTGRAKPKSWDDLPPQPGEIPPVTLGSVLRNAGSAISQGVSDLAEGYRNKVAIPSRKFVGLPGTGAQAMDAIPEIPAPVGKWLNNNPAGQLAGNVYERARNAVRPGNKAPFLPEKVSEILESGTGFPGRLGHTINQVIGNGKTPRELGGEAYEMIADPMVAVTEGLIPALGKAKSILLPKFEVSPNATKTIEALKRQGVPENAIPGALLTDAEEAKRAHDALLKSGEYGGYRTRKQFKPVKDAVESGAEDILSEATGKTAMDVGDTVQKGVRKKTEEYLQPSRDAFNELDEMFGDSPVSVASMRNVKKTMNQLASQPGLGTEAKSILAQVQADIDNVKTIKDLRNIRTNLSGMLPKNATTNQRMVTEAIHDALTKTRDNSINLANRTVKYKLENLPSSTKEIPDISQISPLALRRLMKERGELAYGGRPTLHLGGGNLVEGEDGLYHILNPGGGHDRLTPPEGVKLTEIPKYLERLQSEYQGDTLGSLSRMEITSGTVKPPVHASGLDEATNRLSQLYEQNTTKSLDSKQPGFDRSMDQAERDVGRAVLEIKPNDYPNYFTKEESAKELSRLAKEYNLKGWSDLSDAEIVSWDGDSGKFLAVGKGGKQLEIDPAHISEVLKIVAAKGGNTSLVDLAMTMSSPAKESTAARAAFPIPSKKVNISFWDSVAESGKLNSSAGKGSFDAGPFTFQSYGDGTFRIWQGDKNLINEIPASKIPGFLAENDPMGAVAKDLAKKGFKIPKEIIKDPTAVNYLKAADKNYSTVGEGLSQALPYETKRKMGITAPVKALEAEQPQLVRKRLNLFQNPKRLEAFKEMFPEEYEILRRAELARVKASASNPQGKLVPGRVKEEIFGAPRGEARYQPEVRPHLLGGKMDKANDVATILRSMSENYNPSGTSAAESWKHSNWISSPKQNFGSLLEYSKLKLRSPSVASVLNSQKAVQELESTAMGRKFLNSIRAAAVDGHASSPASQYMPMKNAAQKEENRPDRRNNR